MSEQETKRAIRPAIIAAAIGAVAAVVASVISLGGTAFLEFRRQAEDSERHNWEREQANLANDRATRLEQHRWKALSAQREGQSANARDRFLAVVMDGLADRDRLVRCATLGMASSSNDERVQALVAEFDGFCEEELAAGPRPVFPSTPQEGVLGQPPGSVGCADGLQEHNGTCCLLEPGSVTLTTTHKGVREQTCRDQVTKKMNVACGNAVARIGGVEPHVTGAPSVSATDSFLEGRSCRATFVGTCTYKRWRCR